MITSLKNFTYESTGFDLLETGNDNPSSTGQWFRKEAAEYEAKAKDTWQKKNASSITPSLATANNWIATRAFFSL